MIHAALSVTLHLRMAAVGAERQLVLQSRFECGSWLCPALLKYLSSPPQKIFAQFKAKPRRP